MRIPMQRRMISSDRDSDASVDGGESSIETGHDVGKEEDDRDEVKEIQKLAKRETRNIKVWRSIVVLLLLAVGASVSTLTFIFLRDEETDDYVDAYYLFANTVSDITDFRVENMFEAMRGMSDMVTAHANDNNRTFPFVTLPQFETLGDHARVQSGIETFNYLPFVSNETRLLWETYSVAFQGWIAISRSVVLERDNNIAETDFVEADIPSGIFELKEFGPPGYADFGRELYAPVWQTSPPPFNPFLINFNIATLTTVRDNLKAMGTLRDSIFSTVVDVSFLSDASYSAEDHEAYHALFVTSEGNETVAERPHTYLLTPVYERLGNKSSDVVGAFVSTVAFDRYLADLLPDRVRGIFAILKNTCGQEYSYELTGTQAVYLGEGDVHDRHFDSRKVVIPFNAYSNQDRTAVVPGHCEYEINLYPSANFANKYNTNEPVIFASSIAVTFFLMAFTFFVYDRFVHRRNTKVVNAAARSSAIVTSLFPSNVRARLYEEAEEKAKQKISSKLAGVQAPQSQLKDFLNGSDSNGKVVDFANEEDELNFFKSKPIAELFPNTTIMFGDIAGFTAWSSSREPAQVFTLLETLYHAFDEIAKKRRVFKVETVGDCYVAVTGLPDPRKDHAVVMARFARDCMHKMQNLSKKLEVSLGPDTGDLAMRIGLHSGPVTAGVLRGERSRFQLFGDTMNVASRMESTGVRDRVQLSQDCADLLAQAGKAGWFTPREDTIVAKGKGEMKTYWLSAGDRTGTESTTSNSDFSISGNGFDPSWGGDFEPKSFTNSSESDRKVLRLASGKANRLIDWNVDVLLRLLKQVVARRRVSQLKSPTLLHKAETVEERIEGNTVLDEVKEIIALPEFDAKAAIRQDTPDSIALGPEVCLQLHEYVSHIAAMYQDNPFHNFEHASHVTMSVVKLLSRIVAPSEVVAKNEGKKKTVFASRLHDHTYGITSDPLTQFACVFSALIHDVDHSGVPNAQLVKENSKIAAFYKGKSVAEQNSIDLAWDLLMDYSFNELRSIIYTTTAEKSRFRQLVVNSVMATDIMDKGLKQLRNARWESAFSGKLSEEDATDTTNRKATIVIEHLIQASDVAHTMQHWHIYRKWNERFFTECYQAFQNGRSDTDPTDSWYNGELGFFDFYIIPLAKKLKECGVFGVSSDEYLNYAMRNRKEWEDRGQEIVREMAEKIAKARTTSL
jgi:class 3 adenylate cyclase